MPAALLILGSGAANAGQTIDEAGAMACVTDKWDEKEPEKGHKLVDYAGRCVVVPDDPAAPKIHRGLRGKVRVHARRELEGRRDLHRHLSRAETRSPRPWEEGSHLKEYTYKITGGTGKYQGASGGGTYIVREPDGHPLAAADTRAS